MKTQILIISILMKLTSYAQISTEINFSNEKIKCRIDSIVEIDDAYLIFAKENGEINI